jgi:hypothetical protein
VILLEISVRGELVEPQRGISARASTVQKIPLNPPFSKGEVHYLAPPFCLKGAGRDADLDLVADAA